MPKTLEDFDLGSGLADDFDGEITAAEFGINPEYASAAGKDIPGVIITIKSPDLGQEISQFYSIGDPEKWEIADNGSEVTFTPKPEAHKFNMNSRGGQLVTAMFESAGGGDKKKGQEFFLKRDYWMTQAGFYVGTNWHWGRFLKANPIDPAKPPSSVLFPTALLGETKVAKAEVSEDADIARIIALAEGKTPRELKQAIVNEFKGKPIVNKVLNKGLLKELEDKGKLALGPDGKFV